MNTNSSEILLPYPILRTAKTKRNTGFRKNVEKSELLYIADRNVKSCQLYKLIGNVKQPQEVPQKAK